MNPSSLGFNVFNGRFMNIKFFRQKSKRVALKKPHFYLFNLISGQFGRFYRFAFVLPAFIHHVFNVVYCCAQKQMKRVNARGVVAFVQHLKAFIKKTKLYFISHPMGFLVLRRNPKVSIPVFIFSGLPQPAFLPGSNLNLAPKPFFCVVHGAGLAFGIGWVK